jgi:integrase
VAEILTEVMGKLIAAPSKTRAGRRTVGLPPFVVRELEAHLAVAQRPSGHVFTAPGGGPLRVPSFRAAVGYGDQGSRPAGLHITIFATPR